MIVEAEAQVVLRPAGASSSRPDGRSSQSLVQAEVEVGAVVGGGREVLKVLRRPGQVGQRDVTQQSLGRRIDHVLRDGRVGKRQSRRRIEDLDRLAVHQGLREIAAAFQRGRHRGQEVVRRVAVAAVVVEEEEGLRAAVVNVWNVQRAADRCAESAAAGMQASPTAAPVKEYGVASRVEVLAE